MAPVHPLDTVAGQARRSACRGTFASRHCRWRLHWRMIGTMPAFDELMTEVMATAERLWHRKHST
jgi:hypothetical protein